MASKAIEINYEPPEPTPPQILLNNPKPSKAQAAKAKKAAAAANLSNAAPQTNNNNNTTASSNASTAAAHILTGAKPALVPISSNSNNTSDVKPNIVTLQQQTISGALKPVIGNTVISGGATIAGPIGVAGGRLIKQEHPPPLHPTLPNPLLHHQQQLPHKIINQHQNAGGSMSNVSGSSAAPTVPTLPIVASLDPNRIMPVNITLPAQAGSMTGESRVLTIHVPASALQENQLTQILTAHLISSIMTLPTSLACSVLQQHVNAALIGPKSFNTSKQLDGLADTIAINKTACSQMTFDNAKGEFNIHINAGVCKKRQQRNKTSQAKARKDLDKMLATRLLKQQDTQLDGAVDSSEEDESEESEDNIDNDEDDIDKEDEDDMDNDGGAEEEPLNSEDDVTEEEDAGELFDTENVIVCQYDKITRSRNKWKFYLKDGIMNIGGKDYVFQKSNGDAEW